MTYTIKATFWKKLLLSLLMKRRSTSWLQNWSNFNAHDIALSFSSLGLTSFSLRSRPGISFLNENFTLNHERDFRAAFDTLNFKGFHGPSKGKRNDAIDTDIPYIDHHIDVLWWTRARVWCCIKQICTIRERSNIRSSFYEELAKNSSGESWWVAIYMDSKYLIKLNLSSIVHVISI